MEDVRALGEVARLRTEVCIVGAGPVGLTLAAELSAAGVDVIVVESGGLEPAEWTESLNEFESVGVARVMEPSATRNRALGGSSATWSGRVATFDDEDFRPHPWLPRSGWPIARAELTAYFERSKPYLGISIADNNDPIVRDAVLGRDAHVFDPSLLQDYIWSYSRDARRPGDFMRFGPRALAEGATGARVLLQATVRHILTTDGRAVTGVETVDPEGTVRTVEARTVVLCAGGIDNARILLASDRDVSGGVGNAHDQVGRYLMDHPRGPVGDVPSAGIDAVQRAFRSHRLRFDGSPTVVTRGVTLSPSLREREELVGAAAWFTGDVSPDDAFEALARGLRRDDPIRAARDVVRDARRLAGGLDVLRGRSPLRRMENLQLTVMVEQEPHPDSRITLSERTDALGIRRARVDWRVGEVVARSGRRLAQIFAQELERLGLPRLELSEMMRDGAVPFDLPDVAHPMGTTRMSGSARDGVVDADCAVHGVAGLFCAGASVFSTSSHTNPTQTAVALAIRLADHLIAERRGRRESAAARGRGDSPRPAVNPAVPAEEARPLVLVTGARGKIGSRLVPLLVEHGFAVRAMTSGERPPATPFVQWWSRDLRRGDLDFSSEVRGCVGVLHLGAEMHRPDAMVRTNLQATGALARAAEDDGVGFFCYLSSVSVYGWPPRRRVGEESATITPERDVPSEYRVDPVLRAYGRSKLGGERALGAAAHSAEYVVFRPTVVVGEGDLDRVLSWRRPRRVLIAHRDAHHIDVADVAAAVVWALERSLGGDGAGPGVVETFNLGDRTLDDPTYGGLLAEVEGHPSIVVRALMKGAAAIDWSRDGIRSLPGSRRRSPGTVRFDTERLREAGFVPPHGMTKLRSEVVARHRT